MNKEQGEPSPIREPPGVRVNLSGLGNESREAPTGENARTRLLDLMSSNLESLQVVLL